MRRQSLRRFAFLPLVAIALFGGIAYTAPQSDQSDRGVAPIYGITIPTGYRDWKVVSVAHEAGRLNDLCGFPHGDSVRRWWTWVRSGWRKKSL